jgi:hypothetical protein
MAELVSSGLFEGGEAMAFVHANATIQIDLDVTRYRVFREDGMVEVWGYAGDYEVCVHLPLDDVRLRSLLARAGAAGGKSDESVAGDGRGGND